MKNRTVGLTVIFIFIFGATAFARDNFLFEQNFIGNNISTVFVDDGWYGFDTIINIGFSAGRRVVHNGFIPLLDHVIPDSALAVLTREELRLLRNTIFARHGMIFQSNDLTIHFRQFYWYNPRSNNVDDRLTENDRINIRNIQVFENARPNSNLNRRDLVRGWFELFPVPSWSPEIEINENNSIRGNKFGEDNWAGTFRIENGFLVLLITEQRIGAPDYVLNPNWRWPAGVTYSNGIVRFREPIRMVFPVGDSTRFTHDGSINQRRQIGSVVWTSWTD